MKIAQRFIYYNLLIEPFGIEIRLRYLHYVFEVLLIEPFGIEINNSQQVLNLAFPFN